MQAVDQNIKLLIEYDGTAFSGWQRQKADRTVQGEIEKALATMLRQPVALIGSGRTDAGVHALGQVANFHCRSRLTAVQLHHGLNSLLPADIVIHTCEAVDASFHARFDALSKTYRYTILNRTWPAAIGRGYVWHVRGKLELEAMRRCIAPIRGRHDFKAFEGAGSPRAHSVRTVFAATVTSQPDERVRIEIKADGFLRFMVRNLVGSLVAVGLGKFSVGRFRHILAGQDRRRAAATAPAQGLCLMRVDY